jgi:CheY-specific phosphatase CheX
VEADELVEAFAAAVPFALREMAGVEAVAGAPRHSPAADGLACVSAAIRLTTVAGEWLLVMAFPEATVAALAARVLAETGVGVTPDLVRDCAGEVANVVAGQAKSLLVGRPAHFTLSTPTVSTTCSAEAEAPTGRWVIPFESDVGAFEVRLEPLA